MKFTKILSAMVVCGALVPHAAAAQSEAKQTLSFGISVSNFDQEGGSESGQQIFAPLQYTYSTPRFDFGLKTAFLSSDRNSNFAGGSGDVSTLTDTALSGTYRAYSGTPEWLGRRATFALNADINLPTGQSQLTGDEKNAVFDGFIVDQDRFGEGLNIGLGFSSTVALTDQTLFGFGASYISRGSYEPDGDAPNRELDPGDQWVASLQLLHTTDVFQGVIGYRIIDEQETNVDSVAVYDRATSHELFLSGAYKLDERWTVRGSALYARRSADKLFNAVTGQLEKAAEDNNGDTYYLSLGVDHALSSRDKIGIDVSYRRQAENEFDESNFSFEPSLTRREIEISYARKLRSGPTITGAIAFFDVDEGDILGFDGPKFNGTKFTLGVTHAF